MAGKTAGHIIAEKLKEMGSNAGEWLKKELEEAAAATEFKDAEPNSRNDNQQFVHAPFRAAANEAAQEVTFHVAKFVTFSAVTFTAGVLGIATLPLGVPIGFALGALPVAAGGKLAKHIWDRSIGKYLYCIEDAGSKQRQANERKKREELQQIIKTNMTDQELERKVKAVRPQSVSARLVQPPGEGSDHHGSSRDRHRSKSKRHLSSSNHTRTSSNRHRSSSNNSSTSSNRHRSSNKYSSASSYRSDRVI